MPLYAYKATTSGNVVKTGTLAAPNPHEVAQILTKQNLNPVTIKEEKAAVNVTGELPMIEKIYFCRYVGTMLNSGLTLIEGIPVLKQETKNPLMKQILNDVMYYLERGQPLSVALANYPRVFDKFFITLVKAGEVSGTLDASFKYLEKELRANYSLSSKIKSALMYPSIVFIAMIGIGFLMFFFIMPQIGKVFLSMTLPLPAITKHLFQFAIAAAKYKFQLIAFSIILFVAFILFMKKPAGKKIMAKLISPVPIINRLMQQVDIARFCRIFSTLAASAVPITEALDIALSSLNHPRFKGLSHTVTEEIIQGKSVSYAFTHHHVFPPLLTQMIAAGEKSGTLDTSLSDLADFYEEEVEEAVKKATQLLEPLLMLLVGVGVGAIILAIIAPLYSVVGNLQTSMGR